MLILSESWRIEKRKPHYKYVRVMNMKYEKIVSQMTLEDKISFCEGADFWHTKAFEKYGIPSIMMCDGPHGLRKQENNEDHMGINKSKPSTCFPAACATGSSWDREMLKEIGNAIAKEALSEEISIVLGPGINIKRNPLCGRNFEYLSEDPYAAGELGAAFIQGLEELGVAASLKHFAANSQESKRFTSSSVLDERTLREIYLSGFERAVKKGKPSTVMCAYNKINGTYCSSNKYLLTDILRKEWGFEGVLITDWGAMNHKAEAYMAGCDLEMPGGHYFFKDETIKAVKEGRLPEKLVDETVDRLLTLVFKAAEIKNRKYECDKKAHHELARKAAAASAVLLKNDDDILPLDREQKIAVIGQFARRIRYQGTGSSFINPVKLVNATDAFEEKGVKYDFYEGCTMDGGLDPALLAEAVKGASKAEVAVVFAGLTDIYESEGFDRETMDMPDGHIKMIEEVSKVNPNTVVVLMAGSPVLMPWLGRVKAVLHMYLPGEAGGEAACDLLFGSVNPSGRLSESYPLCYEDVPSSGFYEGGGELAEYREGIYVGYRYYDRAKKDVLFPFGYGLSYTSFEYSDMEVKGNNTDLTVNVKIRNRGKRAGAEVLQLYVRDMQSSIHRPEKELKGFEKVYLKEGESKKVSFSLNKRSFAYYDVNTRDWQLQGGEYDIIIARSSRDMELSQRVKIEGTIKALHLENLKGTWYEDLEGKPEREDLEALMGRKIEDYRAPKRKYYTLDNSIIEMKSSFVMRIMYRAIEKTNAKTYGKIDYSNPVFRMAMICSTEVPMKNLSMLSGGAMKRNIAKGLVHMANGRFIKGIMEFLRKYK